MDELTRRAPRATAGRLVSRGRFAARAALAAVVSLLFAASNAARAEVVAFADERRATAPDGIETIRGVLRIEVDPADPTVATIADLALAPRDARGRVACEADIEILRHTDRSRACGVVFLEAPNRGGRPLERNFGSHGAGAPGATPADPGGARFLLSLGFDVAWVGWQFDVERDGRALGLSVPDATGVANAEGAADAADSAGDGNAADPVDAVDAANEVDAASNANVVRATLVPDSRAPSLTFRDLHGYTPRDAGGDGRTLTVRTHRGDTAVEIARDRWTLDGNTVTLDGGFEPGHLYELAYRPRAFPVAGLGLVALRDAAIWLKHGADSPLAGDRTLAFGLSQSGRLLNTVLRRGMVADADGRAAFDGVWSHIAGAAGIDLDRRGATPTSLSDYETTIAPFSIAAMRARLAPAVRPRTMHTNTSCEYWLGGRMAALLHVAPDASRDLDHDLEHDLDHDLERDLERDLAPDTDARVYLLAGTQHGPAPSILHLGGAAYPENPVETRWTLRALAAAWRDWLADGVAPPADRLPRLDDGTLVPLERFTFPAIPAVAAPDAALVPPVVADRGPLPVLVPATDRDGNERAGIRTAELTVPLATFTGWNRRRAMAGAPPLLATLVGARLPFAVDDAARRAAGDPRESIAARYASRDAYDRAARAAIEALVEARFLLVDDAPRVLERMRDAWESTVAPATRGASGAR
ncbi:MAG: hypothetical protein RI967_286 [Planctomycetota bacterium]